MNEIKCPNCGEVFTVNESQYAELLSQVRTAEFDKELHDRMKQELALAEQKAMNEQQSKLAQKDQEIAQLQSQIQNFDIEKELAKKEHIENIDYYCPRNSSLIRYSGHPDTMGQRQGKRDDSP